MVDYTPNMKMVIPVENQTPWTENMDGNLSIIDAMMGQFLAIPGFTGAWDNGVSYTVGQVVVEVPASTIWNCNVSHTSGGGTFSADRTAHPSYWTLVGGTGYTMPDAVKKSGDLMTGRLSLRNGLDFGNVVASSNTDTSKHISLYSTSHGINVTSGTLNLISSAVDHVINGTVRLHVSGAGVDVTNVLNAGQAVISGLHTCNALTVVTGIINGNGWKYDDLPDGNHATAFVWTGTQLDAYVDGNRIGRVTIT